MKSFICQECGYDLELSPNHDYNDYHIREDCTAFTLNANDTDALALKIQQQLTEDII